MAPVRLNSGTPRITKTFALGRLIGRHITVTDLPQTVAALHSVVGLAAVFTSFGSVMADIAHISTVHLATAYLGVLIGISG